MDLDGIWPRAATLWREAEGQPVAVQPHLGLEAKAVSSSPSTNSISSSPTNL
jgi:hypothetical protein